MKLNVKTLLLAACVASSTAALPSAAAVLVNNLEEPTRAVSELSAELWAAQSFVTDAQSYTLTSVEVPLGTLTGSPVIVAELHAQGGSFNVGTKLTTFTVPSVPAGSPAIVSLTPNSAVTLDPNATYWVVLGTSDNGSFGWSYAEGNVTTGPGSLSAYGYSYDAGATWLSSTFDTPNPYHIRVQVAGVPCGPR